MHIIMKCSKTAAKMEVFELLLNILLLLTKINYTNIIWDISTIHEQSHGLSYLNIFSQYPPYQKTLLWKKKKKTFKSFERMYFKFGRGYSFSFNWMLSKPALKWLKVSLLGRKGEGERRKKCTFENLSPISSFLNLWDIFKRCHKETLGCQKTVREHLCLVI